MFIAAVIFEAINEVGYFSEKKESWVEESLKEMQLYFWNVFHRTRAHWTYALICAEITDTESGRTWAVNDYGRKLS